MAELMETPFMVLVTILAARSIVRYFELSSSLSARARVGCIALGLMLVAEVTLVLRLGGRQIREYLVSRDPAATIVYYAAPGLFALMPLFVART
jgi:hypothetical protein